jgi:hypothetical protein
MHGFPPRPTNPEEWRAIHAYQEKDETMINQPNPRTTDDSLPRETVNPGASDAIVRPTTTDGSYAESRSASDVDAADNQVENQTEVYEDKNQGRANIRSWVSTIVYYLLGMLEIILALRFLFRLLGASQDNGFIVFLYNLSYMFVVPFSGIFNNPILGTHNVFELSTLIAMLVYALIAWGLVALSRVVFAPNYSGRQWATITWRKQR